MAASASSRRASQASTLIIAALLITSDGRARSNASRTVLALLSSSGCQLIRNEVASELAGGVP